MLLRDLSKISHLIEIDSSHLCLSVRNVPHIIHIISSFCVTISWSNLISIWP